MKLPPQAWAARPGAHAVLAALDAAGDQTRIVGGAVRDALLGLPVSDVDLATRLLPDMVVARLTAAGITAVPTGIAHGTVTAVTHGEAFEVTTLRRDIATDGRHATVEFSDDWQVDASRRDFTINALYANAVTGTISDFYAGIADLAERRVRFIGPPLQRIAEDHLRILRFFRFHARFGRGPLDAPGLAACAARANDLMALSRERVRGEVLKLLEVADPVPTVTTMLAHGIFAPVLPEIEAVAALTRVVAAEAALALPPSPLRRLAALLPRDAATLDAVATRLRLSNIERARLVASAGRGGTLLEHAYHNGADSALDRLALDAKLPLSADAKTSAQTLQVWIRPRLPISGKDLIARGIMPGPEVSRRLAGFERVWIAAGFPHDPTRIAMLVDHALVN